MRVLRGVLGSRPNGSPALLLSLLCGLVVAACGSTSPSVAVTATPHSVVAYTCASKNLPVDSSYALKSCTLSNTVSATDGQLNNVEILRSTYVGPRQQSGTVVDSTKLQADRWQSIEQESVGKAPSSRSGDALFFNQRAWLTYHYDNAAGTLSVEEAIPTDVKALVTCGQALTTGTAQRQGLPLPSTAVTTDSGLYTVVPACLNDVKAYYPAALSAAGWTQTQAFKATATGSSGVPALLGTYTHNGTSLAIWLSGASGTCTAIIVRASA